MENKPDWTDMLLAPPESIPDYIIEDSEDWWICKCKNEPHFDGFSPCSEIGARCEPDEQGWDGTHYLCERCFRIIDQHTLQIIGVPSEEVIQQNESYRWHDEEVFDK
jgi:hypothetical protein